MQMRHAVALFYTKAQDVGDPAFALRKPVGIVIEQKVDVKRLTSARSRNLLEFVIQKITAQNQPQHLASGDTTLCRAKDDIARNRDRILLHAVADVDKLLRGQREAQFRKTAASQHAQEPQLGGRADYHVSTVGGGASIAHDRDAVGLQLALVEKFVVGCDPLRKGVGVVKRLLQGVALQRNATCRKEVLALDQIALTHHRADSTNIGPTRCGLPRASQESGGLQLVLTGHASIRPTRWGVLEAWPVVRPIHRNPLSSRRARNHVVQECDVVRTERATSLRGRRRIRHHRDAQLGDEVFRRFADHGQIGIIASLGDQLRIDAAELGGIAMAHRDAALEIGISLNGGEFANNGKRQLSGIRVVEQHAQIVRLVRLQSNVSTQKLLHLFGRRGWVDIGQRVLVHTNRPLHQAIPVDRAALGHQQRSSVACDQRDLRVVGMSQLFSKLAEEDSAIAKHHALTAENVGDQACDTAGFDRQGLHPLRMPGRNDQTRLLTRHAHGADGEHLGD